MKSSAKIGIAVVLLAVAGGTTATLWPEPDPEEPEVVEDTDTGMSRFQTEELMRTIGYVQ
ncbi:MAG: hypothetical protein ACI8RZ_004739 [Myxococcota bacterium]|jgi:hypothetical protein